MNDIGRNHQTATIAIRPDVLAFWQEHGQQWAREEASSEDRAQIAAIAKSIDGLTDDRAAAIAIPKLQVIWNDGFPSGSDAFGWNEMNDRLPDAALLAFVRGVGQA